MSIYDSGAKTQGQEPPEGFTADQLFPHTDANRISDLIEGLIPETEVLTSIPEVNITSNRIIQVTQVSDLAINWGSNHVNGKYWTIHVDANGTNTITNNIPDQASGVKDLDGDIIETSGVRNSFVLGYEAGQLFIYKSTQSSTPSATTLVVTGVTVLNSAPDELVVTFNGTPTDGTTTGLTLTGGLFGLTIDSIMSQVANVWTFQLSGDVTEGQTGNFAYSSSDIEISGAYLQDGSFVVNNQVGDITLPTLSGVSISDITETTSTFNATPSEVADIVWAVYDSSVTRDAASFATVEAGTGSIDFGLIEDAASGVNATDSITGLTSVTDYYVRAYARDAALNESIAYDVDFSSISLYEFVEMGLNTGISSTGDGVFINAATQFNAYFVGSKKIVGSGEITALVIDAATNQSSVIGLEETSSLENTTGILNKIYVDSSQRVAWVVNGGSVNKTTNPVPDNTILSLIWDGNTITWRYTTNNGVNWNDVATFPYSGVELFVKGTPIQVGLQITNLRISSATATPV